MADSFVNYVGDGVQTDFTVPMPFLSRDHISLLVDDVVESFTWQNDTLVRVDSGAPAAAAVVTVRRTTPTTPLTDFENGSTLDEADLDRSLLQSLYVQQEAVDSIGTTLRVDDDDKYNAGSRVIKNVAAPVSGNDAANKTYVDTKAQVAGNVPTPSTPGDDGSALMALSGAWAWRPLVLADVTDAPAFGALATKNTVGNADVDAGSLNIDRLSFTPLTTRNGWEEVGRVTLTGAEASVIFTFSGAYDYELVLDGVKPASAGDHSLYLQLSSDGGTTWTGNTFETSVIFGQPQVSGTAGAFTATDATGCLLTWAAVNNGGNVNAVAHIGRAHVSESTWLFARSRGYNSTNLRWSSVVESKVTATGIHNALRLSFSSGSLFFAGGVVGLWRRSRSS